MLSLLTSSSLCSRIRKQLLRSSAPHVTTSLLLHTAFSDILQAACRKALQHVLHRARLWSRHGLPSAAQAAESKHNACGHAPESSINCVRLVIFHRLVVCMCRWTWHVMQHMRQYARGRSRKLLLAPPFPRWILAHESAPLHLLLSVSESELCMTAPNARQHFCADQAWCVCCTLAEIRESICSVEPLNLSLFLQQIADCPAWLCL